MFPKCFACRPTFFALRCAFLGLRAFFFFAIGAASSSFSPSLCSAPAAARAAPPSPFVAAPVCPVPDCVFAAAAAVAVCPVCSSSSRCRFFVAGVDAAPAVSLLAAAPDLLLLAPSLRCAKKEL